MELVNIKNLSKSYGEKKILVKTANIIDKI